MRNEEGMMSPCSKFEFEQIDGIGSPNLELVGRTDAGAVKPPGCVVNILKWPIGGEEDSV